MAYSSFIGMTSKFKFCGNAFRIDTYKGCTFGCAYCFANNQVTGGHQGHGVGHDVVDIEAMDKIFSRAFDTEESNSLTIELLRHRVPLHCGGMADPFQHREFKLGITKHLIELSNKYNYPICFSTKAAHLPQEYWDILNPELHAFQCSIIGVDKDWCDKFEYNTPSPQERIAFMKELKDKGFWVSLRIQPLVDIEQAKKLVVEVGNIPSYITIEHLKISQTNLKSSDIYRRYVPDVDKYQPTSTVYELPTYMKKKNIEQLLAIANANGVICGIGDNDLHNMSQSRNCCGLDTINASFSEWIKYNTTYFTTGEYNKEEIWTPKSNCAGCLFSHTIHHFNKKHIGYKEYVDNFIARFEEQSNMTNKKKLF